MPHKLLNSTGFLLLQISHLLKNTFSVDASKIIIDVDVTSMSSASIVQNGLEDKVGYRYCCCMDFTVFIVIILHLFADIAQDEVQSYTKGRGSDY